MSSRTLVRRIRLTSFALLLGSALAACDSERSFHDGAGGGGAGGDASGSGGAPSGSGSNGSAQGGSGGEGLGGHGQGGESTALLGLPDYPMPSGRNTVDWTGFADNALPNGFTNVLGYGGPTFADEGRDADGKLLYFRKGWTNVVNLGSYPRDTWASHTTSEDWKSDHIYVFNQTFYIMHMAAKELYDAGIDGGEYGDIGRIANDDPQNTNIDYTGLTVQGAIEIGKHMNWGTANSVDDGAWNISGNGCVITLDEESMTQHSWAGGGHSDLLGYLTQGIWESSQKKKRIFWYAQPITWAFLAMAYDKPWNPNKTDAYFSPSNYDKGSSGWKSSEWYVDANGGYDKVPFPSNTDIYEHGADGTILVENGKRKPRQGDFTVKIFQDDVTFLAQPHDWIKWNGTRADGSWFFGWQTAEWGERGSQQTLSALPSGWSWGNTARPNPSNWAPESALWIDNVYRRADGIMADLLHLRYAETSTWDISKPNTQWKLYQEGRPRTEPWTSGGNAIDPREIGDSAIFYSTYMCIYSGCQATSTWDDGSLIGAMPNKGTPLYRQGYSASDPVWDDYYGRYQAKLAAVHNAFAPLSGSDPTGWVYVHFYYPFLGGQNKNVISSGIYDPSSHKFTAFFLNPTLENGEKQALTLRVGDQAFALELVGHEFYRVELEAEDQADPSRVYTPDDFRLSYRTIDGVDTTVTGRVTNDARQHYLSGLGGE